MNLIIKNFENIKSLINNSNVNIVAVSKTFTFGDIKPLVDYGFFELTIPPILKDGKEKWSTSPKLKYRLTGKFVSKKSSN